MAPSRVGEPREDLHAATALWNGTVGQGSCSLDPTPLLPERSAGIIDLRFARVGGVTLVFNAPRLANAAHDLKAPGRPTACDRLIYAHVGHTDLNRVSGIEHALRRRVRHACVTALARVLASR